MIDIKKTQRYDYFNPYTIMDNNSIVAIEAHVNKNIPELYY